MKKTNMIMAAFLTIAMLVSMIPVIDAGVPAIETNDIAISNVNPGNYYNNTTAPTYINFTADITGITTGDVVYLNISSTGHEMTNNSGTYYYNWTDASGLPEGKYTYWVEVKNATGNVTNTSESFTVLIDTDGPLVDSVKTPIEEGNPAVFVITDNASGVNFANITVNVAGDDANKTYFNVSATNGAVTFSRVFKVGTYNYTVYAEDVSGHNTSANGTFEVTADTTAPAISDVNATPATVAQDGYVNITADVTDTGVGVDTVMVNITYPNGTAYNKSMTVYNGTYFFNTSYNAIGTYTFFVWANDTKDNSISSAESTFTVTDGTAPVIQNATAVPDNTIVTISAIITDNVGVASATVSIYNSTGAALIGYPTDMTGINGTYTYTSEALALGNYSFNVSASDAAGNNVEVSGSFAIVDTEAPVISNISVPENIVENQDVTVSCTVTDNVEVASVTIAVDGGNATDMTLADGIYTYTIPSASVSFGDHTFVITATDEAGLSSTNNTQFNAADAEKPIATPSTDNPTEATLGSSISIKYTVDDPDGMQSVVLYYYVDDNSSNPQQVTMTLTNGTYVGEIPVPSSGSNLTYWVLATDNSGSTTTSAQQTLALKAAPSGMSTAMLAGIGILLLIIIIAVVMMMKKKPAEAPEEGATEEESEEEPVEEEESEELSEEDDDLEDDL